MRKNEAGKKQKRKQKTPQLSRQASSTLPFDAAGTSSSATDTHQHFSTRRETFEEFRQRREKLHFGNPSANEFFSALAARDIPKMSHCLATGKIDINSKIGSSEVGLFTPQLTLSPFTPQLLAQPTSFGQFFARTAGRVNGTFFGVTPLYKAAELGYTDVVNFLIDHGAIVDCDCNHGLTPLFVAITSNHFDVVSVLLTRGAKVGQMTDDQSTPLHFALQHSSEQIIDVLLHYGADVNQPDDVGETPLIVVIMTKDDPNIVAKLIAAGADVKKAKPNGVTPLFVAAQENRTHSMEVLLQKGADVNAARNTDDLTPLQVAACAGHLNAVKLLISHHADVNHRCVDGRTALFYAETNGFKSVSGYLRSLPAPSPVSEMPRHTSPTSTFQNKALLCTMRQSPGLSRLTDEEKAKQLFRAVIEHSPTGVREAISLGGDINYHGIRGKTALHLAAYFEYNEIMEILMKAGAKVDVLTKAGETPLDIARTYQKEKAVAFLSRFPLANKTKEVWYDEGLHLLQQGKVNDALRYFHQAIKIDPIYTEPVYHTIQILLAKGKTDLAVERLDRYQTADGADLKVLALRQSCAVQYVGQDIPLDSVEFLLQRGIEFQRIQKYDLAKKYFSAVIALHPDCWNAKKLLVQLAEETGEESPCAVIAKLTFGSMDIGVDDLEETPVKEKPLSFEASDSTTSTIETAKVSCPAPNFSAASAQALSAAGQVFLGSSRELQLIQGVIDFHDRLINEIMPIVEKNPNDFAPFLKAIQEKAYGKALRRACTVKPEAKNAQNVFELVKILISYKEELHFDINEKGSGTGETAYDYAVSTGNQGLCRFLEQNGAAADRKKRAVHFTVEHELSPPLQSSLPGSAPRLRAPAQSTAVVAAAPAPAPAAAPKVPLAAPPATVFAGHPVAAKGISTSPGKPAPTQPKPLPAPAPAPAASGAVAPPSPAASLPAQNLYGLFVGQAQVTHSLQAVGQSIEEGLRNVIATMREKKIAAPDILSFVQSKSDPTKSVLQCEFESSEKAQEFCKQLKTYGIWKLKPIYPPLNFHKYILYMTCFEVMQILQIIGYPHPEDYGRWKQYFEDQELQQAGTSSSAKGGKGTDKKRVIS